MRTSDGFSKLSLGRHEIRVHNYLIWQDHVICPQILLGVTSQASRAGIVTYVIVA